jgi:hypothetical protein
MVFIPSLNIVILSIEIDFKYGMNVGRCEHKKERFSSSNFHKIHKSTVFLFLNQMKSPIHMVLISRMNKRVFPTEIDLKYSRYKPTCELAMNGTAL